MLSPPPTAWTSYVVPSLSRTLFWWFVWRCHCCPDDGDGGAADDCTLRSICDALVAVNCCYIAAVVAYVAVVAAVVVVAGVVADYHVAGVRAAHCS